MQQTFKQGIITALAGAGIALAALITYQSQARLRQENTSLREQADKLPRALADNQRLSNLLAQVRVAQTTANDQLQELMKLRAEVNRLRPANEPPDLVAQPTAEDAQREIARLRAEVKRLHAENQEIEKMREELRELRTAASTPPPEEPVESQSPEGEELALALRVIRTQGETFAEKLKRSVAADERETFQEVFGRFLNVNGVETNTIAAAVFDERTGRVIIRAPQATLDQIERLTSALDQAP